MTTLPTSEQLKAHRDEIDAIDHEVLNLVSRRAALAREIGELKDDGVIYRPEREAQVLRRLIERNPGPLSSEAVANIFRGIMSSCRALEKELVVAFLGPLGTFSEEAAIKQFGGLSAPMQCASIDEVFRQVESGAASYGVVPVENSTEGAVGLTLDLLMQTQLKICGEVELAVHHHLLAKNADVSKIKKIYSHSQSIGQCHEWLNQHLVNAERVSVVSNAEAARLASIEQNNVAAIASHRAAQLFDLNILAENIEDDPKNTTRFLVITQHDVAPSGRDKTSLIIATKNVPGAMLAIVEPLAKHNVSMTKLESRPSKTGMWEYIFFVDIEGHSLDSTVSQAIEAITQKASFVKVLGSYPVAIK
jgi:chorismate mutase / prephenate dehydratase